ncbi:FecCD family ABC transporter permease [Alteribacter natronophilus]|uniref:FecCD family ABC transporter permease n=1 Tax=Alteribacter natronophilus TaxID=2583810 RepID=UPI00110D4A51|nr:iron ABC transporter permease [Alteribacter natronophilus]TMW73643.1 iron ABC transporter permease [Alteribacter natronophilus]
MPKLSTLTAIRKQAAWKYALALIVLLLAVTVGTGIGSVTIPPGEVIRILLQMLPGITAGELEPSRVHIVTEIRLPRVLLAVFAGASLAAAGAAFQGLLRNPLADPYTLGASSGAAVGAVGVIYFGITLPVLGSFTLPVAAIAGGIFSLYLVLLFARVVSRTMAVETIILVGIVLSSFLGSFISLMIALSGEELRQIIHWLMGSVGMRGWTHVGLIVPFFIAGSAFLLFNWRELNVFAFGEQSARHLGIDVKRKKQVIVTGAAILTGAAVAVSGMIGFVGLVVPHFVRLLTGPDHKHLVPLSAIAGGAFLVFADVIARTILSPQELPIGVITALIGAPVFGVILITRLRDKAANPRKV